MTPPERGQAVPQSEMKEPPGRPIPRPEEVVSWWDGGIAMSGTLLGTDGDGRPCIADGTLRHSPPDGFDAIRLSDSGRSRGPIWASLPADRIWRPAADERDRLAALTGQGAPPGPRHGQLAHEIWMRGFEVFFTGAALRETLLGRNATTAELITTMPLDRLRILVKDMYVDQYWEETPGVSRKAVTAARARPGDLLSRAGRIQVGGAPGTRDPYATVRPFRSSRLSGSGTATGARFIFGASFEAEMRFGSFAFDTVCYEPANGVLIDPTGDGLGDISARRLRLPPEASLSPAERGILGIEVIRHVLDTRCSCDEDMLDLVRSLYAVAEPERISALRARVMTAFPDRRGNDLWNDMQRFFEQAGLTSEWNAYIQPGYEDLIRPAQPGMQERPGPS